MGRNIIFVLALILSLSSKVSATPKAYDVVDFVIKDNPKCYRIIFNNSERSYEVIGSSLSSLNANLKDYKIVCNPIEESDFRNTYEFKQGRNKQTLRVYTETAKKRIIMSIISFITVVLLALLGFIENIKRKKVIRH